MPTDLNALSSPFDDHEDDGMEDVTEEDILATGRLFQFVLDNPDAYPELRDELGDALPEKYDRGVLERAIEALQQMSPNASVSSSPGMMQLASLGEGTDTRLAHINPLEDKILRAYGGSGSINPQTGLPQYGLFKKIKKISKKIADPITEGVRKVAKKVVKSRVGKVALGALAAYYFGPAVAAWMGSGSTAASAASGAASGAAGYAPTASPGLMSGLSFSGASGISPSAMSLFGSGGGLASGLDYASLGSIGLSNSSPSFVNGLMNKLSDSGGLSNALAKGVGGLVSYFGSQSAFNDAMKLAKELQGQSQYNPYNIRSPAGTLTTKGNKLNIGYSPTQTRLLRQNTTLGNQQFKELSKFNLNDYVSNYVDWSRQIAAPQEKRAEESLNSMLLNTGMLGSEAGARRYGEFNMNRNTADLQRLIAGETLGANRYSQLNNMWNSSNQNLMNITNAPLEAAKLGLLAGQARSGAATSAAQFPWLVGQEQAGGKSGFWNQVGSSLANALPGAYQNMFGNTGSNLANFTNYTVSPYMSGQYQYV